MAKKELSLQNTHKSLDFYSKPIRLFDSYIFGVKVWKIIKVLK